MDVAENMEKCKCIKASAKDGQANQDMAMGMGMGMGIIRRLVA